MPTKRFYPIVLICAIFLWGAPRTFAAADGLDYGKKIEGKHITAYLSPGLNAADLARQLDIRSSDKMTAGRSLVPGSSFEEELALMLDTLFAQVSDILGMHLYSLRTVLKVCKTEAELHSVYERLFNASLGGRRSFYVYDLNSIYVSSEAFQKGIVGHEISHAIITHYFPIPAPVKAQEVLSMYVEYNLKK